MSTIQDIKYDVVAITSKGTYSLNRYFGGGNIKTQINGVPNANLQFINKNRVLSNEINGLIPPTESFWIAVTASTDSGNAWKRLFVGLVEGYTENLDANSVRTLDLELYDAPEFRYDYITPNQIAIGNCNFGTLFAGTNTASDGTSWSSDSFGNYPNGLLYDTGFRFASVPDAYSGVPDVPFRTAYNNYKKLDAIKSWLDNYAMCFVLDVNSQSFYIRKLPAVEPFPYTGNVLAVGDKINKYSNRINLSDANTCITVVNPDNMVFDIYGTGLKENIIVNTDILSFKASRNQSKLQYNASRNYVSEFSIVMPPTNEYLIGKSILFRETDGYEKTLSVVEMSQNISPDRWETAFVFNNPKFSEAKTIIEISDEIQQKKQEDLAGQVFIRASSGASKYYIIEGDSKVDNICAIGFGMTHDTDSNGAVRTDSGIKDPIIIKPIMGVNTESSGATEMRSAYVSLNSEEGNRLIRQIVLFANKKSDNELQFLTDSFNWSARPTGEWNAGISSLVKINLGTFSGRYFVSLDTATLSSLIPGCYVHSRNAKQIDVKYLNSWTPYYSNQFPPHPTATIDGTAEADSVWATARQLSPAQLDNMSRDMRKESVLYSVATFSNLTYSSELTASSGRQIDLLFEYDMPVEPSSEAYKYFRKLNYGFHAWASYSHQNGSGSTPALLYIYGDDYVNYWKCVGTISSQSSCSWFTGSIEEGTVFGPLAYNETIIWTAHKNKIVTTDSGKIRMAVYVPTLSAYSGATLSLFVQYAGISTDIKAESGSGGIVATRYVEKCYLDYRGHIIMSREPTHIYGMYSNATELNGGWKVDTAEPNLLPPSKWRENNDLMQFWKPKPIAVKRDRHRPSIRTRAGPKKKFIMTPEPQYPGIEDYRMEKFYYTVVANKYIFMDYDIERMSANVSKPSPIEANIISASFTDGCRGSQSLAYIDISEAPPYWCNIDLAYSCVSANLGTPDRGGGTIGKASFIYDTESSVREGIDKNAFKTLNVQYDWYRQLPQSSGGIDGGIGDTSMARGLENPINRERHSNIIMRKPYPFRYI